MMNGFGNNLDSAN